MIPHHLELYPPAHPHGCQKLWFWRIKSPNDIAISGTSDDKQDALDQATSALEGVMQEEANHDSV